MVDRRSAPVILFGHQYPFGLVIDDHRDFTCLAFFEQLAFDIDFVTLFDLVGEICEYLFVHGDLTGFDQSVGLSSGVFGIV